MMHFLRSLLKQFIHTLTTSITLPKEASLEPWEDVLIRLAFKHWILKAGRPVPKWDEFRIKR